MSIRLELFKKEAWKEIEKNHSNVKVWETVTPCFEKKKHPFLR